MYTTLVNGRVDLSKARLRVVVYLEEPFVMRADAGAESKNELENEPRYMGFCVDLLDELAKVRRPQADCANRVSDRSYSTSLTRSSKMAAMECRRVLLRM